MVWTAVVVTVNWNWNYWQSSYNNEHTCNSACAFIFFNGYFDALPYMYASSNRHLITTSWLLGLPCEVWRAAISWAVWGLTGWFGQPLERAVSVERWRPAGVYTEQPTPALLQGEHPDLKHVHRGLIFIPKYMQVNSWTVCNHSSNTYNSNFSPSSFNQPITYLLCHAQRSPGWPPR